MKEDSSTRWKQEKKEKQEEEEEEDLRGEELCEEDRMAASKLTCLEDMMELVGSCGRWNVGLFLLCSSSIMFNALITMSYQFVGFTPDHWCHVQDLKEANWTDQQILNLAIPFNNKTGQYEGCHMYDYNYTEAALLGYDSAVSHLNDLTDGDTTAQVVPCSVRDFNLTQYKSSIVTEWDLVCERRVLYSTTQAVNQLGFLIGAVMTPIFTDKFGRRPVAMCVLGLTLLQGLLSSFATTANMFIGLKCGLSIAIYSHYLCCFLILMELCTPSTRSSFGSLIVMAWAIGCIVVPGIAYLIRPWRYLQATLVLPYLIFVITYRMLPESPRWLLLQGRYKDVEDILVKIATTNRHNVPSRAILRAALTRIGRQMRAEQSGSGDPRGKSVGRLVAAVQQVLSPYSTVQSVSKMCLMLVLWFSASCSYYGLALNATNISADPYLYLLLGGLAEVPAYLILWLLVARAGRRPSLSGLYFFCALCIAVNAALMFAFPSVPVQAKIALSLLGKMAVAAAFHLLYLFTVELFTTQQRSLALGHSSFFGRIGSVSSPYINDILGDTAAWAPSTVFAVLSTLSSLLSLLLPETRNQNLPEEDNRKDKEKECRKSLKSDPSLY